MASETVLTAVQFDPENSSVLIIDSSDYSLIDQKATLVVKVVIDAASDIKKS